MVVDKVFEDEIKASDVRSDEEVDVAADVEDRLELGDSGHINTS